MKYILIVITATLAFLCYLNYDFYKKTKNIKFVDTAYLYDNFKLKKELEITFNEVKTLKQAQLDSLYDVIITVKNSGKETDIKTLEKRYLSQRSKMTDEQENLRTAYDSNIWSQLNKYIKDFGEQNNIDLIIGANGQGSVMHGNSSMNISEEAINFINKNYSGK